MQLFLLILAASLSTLIGGVLALKISDRRHLFLAFGAGAVLGTALFDLLPESLELIGNSNPLVALTYTAIGFGVYFILNNWIAMTSHTEDHECENDHHRHSSGMLNAGGLSLHSMMDGFVLGLAFQASATVGFLVAMAIIAHRLSDGINAVNIVMKSNGTIQQAQKWLIASAIAPVIGFVVSLFVHAPVNVLGVILAFFAGCFLYIGASDLVPECHHDHPKHLTALFFIFGLGLIWLIVHFCG